MQIPDYYQILEIERSATAREIKRAFRKLAKRYHPDKNPEQVAFAAQMFRQVSSAYTILQDERQKRDYDKTLEALERKKKASGNYQSYTYSKLESLFQALLHQNYETGISVYEQLLRHFKKNGSLCIDDVLSYEESRDCEFLVAEAYQKVALCKRGTQASRYLKQAMEIYESLLSAELQRPYFRHFTAEVKERLKWIYLYLFRDENSHQDTPIPLAKVQALQLPKRETAWVYKKIAEFYVESDRLQEAREVLQLAFELCPRLAGAKKICQRLNFFDA